MFLQRGLIACALAVTLVGAPGCAAVFPELSTHFSKAPDSGSYDPPPPDDRHFVRVTSGKVPPKTRDGRDWDKVLGSLPDPYVKVFVNDKELFRTDPQSDTLEPTWKGSPAGNFMIQVGDKVEIQLWDQSPLNDSPIGVREITLAPDMIDGEDILFDMSGGGAVTLHVSAAKPIWGAGFWYELRNDAAFVSRLVEASPAARGGVQPGDKIVSIDGEPVEKMSLNDVRSKLGSFPAAGYDLALVHKDGGSVTVKLKEGPIYPLFSDLPTLPIKPE